MNDRKLQFRVGIFVIAASLVAAVIVFQFGEFQSLWQPRYTLAIHFDEAPGVYPSTPVRQNGISVGKVSEIILDENHGGVLVLVTVRSDFKLRRDARPRLTLSLLGDASIDFTPGKSSELMQPGDRIKGEPASDPMQIVNQLDRKLTATLDSFEATSREWQKVGRNMNSLMETNEGNLDAVIERTALSLEQFTQTMKNADQTLVAANKIIADPQNQENLQKMLAAMPAMVEETQKTVSAVRAAVQNADSTLSNLNEFTAPLAKRSNSIVTRLDATLGNLETLSREMNDFSQIIRRNDGSLQKLVSDPELYRNLNQSAESLAVVMKNLEPIMRDLRIFSDKVARHPELIGVSGALSGSSGLKDPPPEQQPRFGNSPAPGQPTRR